MSAWVPSVIMSGLALFLGVINFIRTSLNSDRQFAQSYYGDVAKWLASVLEVIREIESSLEPTLSVKERDAVRALSSKLFFHANVGYLYFGGLDYSNRSPYGQTPGPIATVIEAARAAEVLTWDKPPEVMKENRDILRSSSSKLIDEVTSIFGVAERLAAAAKKPVASRVIPYWIRSEN